MPLLEIVASTKAAAEKNCEIKGGGIVHRNIAEIWFKRFNKDNSILVDKLRPSLASNLNEGGFRTVLKKEHNHVAKNCRLH